ncbi:hypothetical protein GTW71_22170, partial [Streptomyces sp. SID6041]|nr:hypothetical protein [Streptomyces sp. SID6041]
VPVTRAESPTGSGPEAAGALRDTGAARARVRDAFLHVLGEDPGDRPLQTLGLDSLMIAELTTALERGGPTVDPSLLLRARTADDIAAELASLPAPAGTPAHAEAPASAGIPAPGVTPAPAGTPAPPAAAIDRVGAADSALSALLRPLLDHDGGRGVVQA